ncbi:MULTISPECIES: extracellular solute-binding protein [unclassified Chelatococcus]|uniref:extracellular solute-binding protein n=1 Tax=unclassified Chelatococcus TaxID=2638111 RepID=UPI001BCAE4E8|nr:MULTISPECIES: extracellular solute-binding protein [unclassified Chelatococcus]MBS7695663.1 ABC transporter substrate-binding protein [Chelatococcus sp. YT9]MBX3557944.1 ABC transporter substrate-binding protein [Chelatococcus sp.]
MSRMPYRCLRRILTTMALLVAVFGSDMAVAGESRTAISAYGEPALPADFPAFPYANPDAPKGGTLRLSILGTFDNLNPFVPKGIAAQGIWLGNRQIGAPSMLVFQGLMARSEDESFSLYALIARAVELPDDRSFIVFHLDPRAHFSDGAAITAADVEFSWALLKEKGQLYQRGYYSNVSKVTIIDPHTIRFDLAAGNRETALVIAQMPVLPKHAINPDTFETTTFTTPIGSGPYVVANVDAGRSITFRRDPNFWARDLPSTRGLYNFDEIRLTYIRDVNTQFEAFKAGAYDLRMEQSASRWATGYDFPALRDGRVIRERVPTGTPKPMSGFVFNTRRPLFADILVREALTQVLDFEWINQNLFFDLYKRSDSYFAASELSSHGRPASARERALLAPFPSAVTPDVMEGRWSPPHSDGSGSDRQSARRAIDILSMAGYELNGARMVRPMPDGRGDEALSFEIMVVSRDQERLALNYARSLQRIGVTASVRLVDEAQYWKRLKSFDFDMILNIWNVVASPGSEQMNRWSVASADREMSLNYAGVREPAAEAMIRAMVAAKSREDYVAAVRALDRVLLSGTYVVPLFYAPDQWIARRADVKRPNYTPLTGAAIESWWHAVP